MVSTMDEDADETPDYPKTLAPVPDTHPDHSIVLAARPSDGLEETSVSGELADTDYDAQADLALAGQVEQSPTDGFTPSSGTLDDHRTEPAYDVDRDTAP